MKKLSLLAASSVLSLAAFAATPGTPILLNKHANGPRLAKTIEVPQNLRFEKATTLQSRASDVITDPAGEAKTYLQEGYGFFIYGYYVYAGATEAAATVVWGDNNDVYIKPAITSWAEMCDGYVKGTVEGNKITVNLPQRISTMTGYNEDEELEEFAVYASLMAYTGEYYYQPVEDNNVITYTIQDDGSLVMETVGEFPVDDEGALDYAEKMLSVYVDYCGSPLWYYCSDVNQTLTPFAGEPTTLPASVELDTNWSIVDAQMDGRHISVAFDGNDVYLSNLIDIMPEAVMKGTLDEEGVVTFTEQYMGVSSVANNFLYFYPAVTAYMLDEEYGSYYYSSEFADELKMEYDAEAKTLRAVDDGSLYLACGSYYSLFIYPIIQYQTAEDMNAAPSAPVLLDYFDGIEDYGYGMMDWTIPAMNVNGYVLDTDKMYYIIYTDGEPYTFYTDTYYYFPDDMTEIPYNFTDDWDLYVEGTEHYFYFYDEGIKTVGCRSFYEGSDGVTYQSDMITYNVGTTAIKTIDATKTVKTQAYYDINGRQVINPTKGFYLQKTVYTDGTTSVAKIAIR